jgi:hypothetical protein
MGELIANHRNLGADFAETKTVNLERVEGNGVGR